MGLRRPTRSKEGDRFRRERDAIAKAATALTLPQAGVGNAKVRVDSWLWAIRVFKTRTEATRACRAGHVQISGERAKAAQAVGIGTEVRVRITGFDRILRVTQPIIKRVPAAVAATCFVDLTPPRPPSERSYFPPAREPGAGRPTKRDRRELDRLRGRTGNS
ncbi:MAG: RNA-binding S4 domain-containing protein [Cryobacterium sp.]|nr:RNA-binding S4 domain-containing protein [Cryobacterium sp.]